MRTGNSEEPRVDAGTAIPTDQQQASSYGPARSVRKNSVGRWIHSATGRWLTREEIRAATDIAGTNTGTPLIIPRVVDANSGTVIRNPIPQISLLDPSAMQPRTALSVNLSNAIQHGYGCGPRPAQIFCRFGMAYFGYGHGRLRGRAVTATAIQKKGVLCST